MANKVMVHYLSNGENTACGALLMGAHQASTFLSDATCKQCIKIAQQEQSIEKGSKALLAAVGGKKVTLYTLAPAALDKPGTESVGNVPWLYKDDRRNIPEQALREVVMPAEKHVAQHQAYTSKTEYITFTEVGLAKELKNPAGKVYRLDNHVNHTNEKEVEMPAKRKPSKAEIIAAEKLERERQIEAYYAAKDIAEIEKPTVSALDAILATPMRRAEDHAAMEEVQAPPVVKEGAAMVNPSGDAPARIRVDGEAQSTIAFDDSMYMMFVRAFKQALKEEGLVIIPVEALVAHAAEEEPEPEPVKDPDIWDVLGYSSEPAAMVPTKRASTLKVFTSKPAEKTVRASSGKTDPAIVKAIQKAWNSGKVTQVELAVKYGMDDKKVWYFCNRARQLV